MIIEFGQLAPLLADQLSGYGIPEARIETCQKYADEISHLYNFGILTNGERCKAEKRVVGKIEKFVTKSFNGGR